MDTRGFVVANVGRRRGTFLIVILAGIAAAACRTCIAAGTVGRAGTTGAAGTGTGTGAGAGAGTLGAL